MDAGSSSDIADAMNLDPLGSRGGYVREDYAPYCNGDDSIEFLAEIPKPSLPSSHDHDGVTASTAGDGDYVDEDYVPYFNDDDGGVDAIEFLAETPKQPLTLSLDHDGVPASTAGYVHEDYVPHFNGNDSIEFLTEIPKPSLPSSLDHDGVTASTAGDGGYVDEVYVPYFNDDDGGIDSIEFPSLSLSLDHDGVTSSTAGDGGGSEAEAHSSTRRKDHGYGIATSGGIDSCPSPGQRPIKLAVPATVEELLNMGGRVNLADLLTPVRPTRKTAKAIAVQDEFFGVYCLISRSDNKAYKNRCYIGYTVNPNRRIRQHNAGRQFGGAKKTDSRGPWDMVCIIHGFPNSISALRFEWAWQNPAKSRRLREFESLQRKARNQTPFEHQLRIACRMLNADPWRRLALTFRWLLPECAISFPVDLPPPPHVQMASGVVTKTETVVPGQLEDYRRIGDCRLCGRPIDRLKRLLRCLNAETCGAHYHVSCLAENELIVQDELDAQLTPLSAHCPVCARVFPWGDLVRDQRMLCSIDAAKPSTDGRRIAEGMVPRKITKL